MKEIILFFALFIVAVSCQTAHTPQKRNAILLGTWKETWDVGEKTNVEYADEYLVRTTATNELLFVCKTHHAYKFKNIIFDGKKLTFSVSVTNKYDNAVYMIDYALNLNSQKDAMEGKAKTNQGKEVKIIWEKIR